MNMILVCLYLAVACVSVAWLAPFCPVWPQSEDLSRTGAELL